MTLRSGIWAYVWADRPAPGALDGFAGVLVRAANGDSAVSGTSGYDFAASWRAWAATYPGRCLPWTYIYPSSHGAASARALFGATGPQPVYQADIEEAVPASVIAEFCATLRALAPGCKLVFDSYPSRAQFARVNGTAATFDAAISAFDAFNPQIYYASQAAYDTDHDAIPDYLDDAKGKPVLPAISLEGSDPTRPASWPDVFTSGAAQRLLDAFGTLALWRYPSSARVAGLLKEDSSMALDPDAKTYLEGKFAALAGAIGVTWYGDDRDDAKDAGTHPYNLQAIVKRLDEAAAQQKAESAAIAALAGMVSAGVNDLTAEQVAATVKDAVAQALAEGTVSVDVSVHGEPTPAQGG